MGTLQETANATVTETSNASTTTPPCNEIDHGLDSINFTDFTDLMPPEAATISPVSEGHSPTAQSLSADPKQVTSQAPSVSPVPSSGHVQKNITANTVSTNQTQKSQANDSTSKVTTNTPSTNLKNATSQNSQSLTQTKLKEKSKGKNANTPDPLTGGKTKTTGTIVSPLPAPASFVTAPAPVPVRSGGIKANMQLQATKAKNNAQVKPDKVKSQMVAKSVGATTNMTKSGSKTSATRKQSSTTIYAPSRQISTPSTISSNASIKKNIVTGAGKRNQNHNAVATAAAVASAQPNHTPSDFTAVAQAAVTNLILNAGNKVNQILQQKNVVSDHDDDSDPSAAGQKKRKIDTSTAHVTALTSPNWVAACASMTSTIPGTSVTAPVVSSNHLPALEIPSNDNDEETPAAKRRRLNLNPEERAKQNRDRNREHARNTRLRKKAYVEELKRTLTELVAQRDASELERRRNAQRELEQREVRFRVMEEFLKLRGTNEPNVARWVAILEDGFTCTLPFTNYRSVVKGIDANAKLTRQVSHDQNTNDRINISEDKQTLYGAPECMADATALSGLLSSLTKVPKTNLIYECDRKRFLMDGTNAVLEWDAKSVGLNQVSVFYFIF